MNFKSAAKEQQWIFVVQEAIYKGKSSQSTQSGPKMDHGLEDGARPKLNANWPRVQGIYNSFVLSTKLHNSFKGV